jgi:hypothetical protein
LEGAGIDRNATRADNFGKDFAVHMPWHIGTAKGYSPALPVFNRCMRFSIYSEVFEVAKPRFSILAPDPDYVEQTTIGVFALRLDKRLAAFKNWAAFADASYSRVNRDPVWYHIGSYDPLKVKAMLCFSVNGFFFDVHAAGINRNQPEDILVWPNARLVETNMIKPSN